MPKVLVNIEVPFWVDYEHQPFERQTLEYPGCQEDVIPTDIEIPDDLEQWLWDNHSDMIRGECWEDWKERNEPHL